MVNHNFKVSPLPRCVSAANAICKDIDIFNNDCVSLMDIMFFNFSLSIFCRFHIVHLDSVSFSLFNIVF
jgi:hypothetical protein